MPHIISNRFKPVLAAAFALLLAGVLLAACGSSNSSTTAKTTSASASASTTTPVTTPTTTTPGGKPAPSNRGAGLRECLAKQGIKLPTPKPGSTSGGRVGEVFGGGGRFKLPAGVTRAKFVEAITKCGGLGFSKRGLPSVSQFKSPAYKAALAKFASCMKEQGVAVPAPNTSGAGPVFNAKGINTKSAKFVAAERKCFPLLRSGFKPPPGGGSAEPGATG